MSAGQSLFAEKVASRLPTSYPVVMIYQGFINPSPYASHNLVAAKIDPPLLFYNLTGDCRPVACKSRKYSEPDKQFISHEVLNLLKEGVIERSHSPWRAQVLVTKDDRHKRRMVIDYSRTINKFTELDAYPLPRLDDVAFSVSRYQVYSALDLKSAYHQIPIAESDKPYTAFEADGGLYQFCRLPFGVTNGVAAFQRIMDQLIAKHGLKVKGTFAYLDNNTRIKLVLIVVNIIKRLNIDGLTVRGQVNLVSTPCFKKTRRN